MKSLYFFIVLIFSSPFTHAQESDKSGFEHVFEQKESSYSFRGNFLLDADSVSVLELIYLFENIPAYTPDIISCKLVQESNQGYDVVYLYKKLMIFKNESKWRRTLHRDEGKIEFNLLSSYSNMSILPEIISLSGYYKVSSLNGRCQVEYFQETELEPGKLQKIYTNEVRKSLIKFLKEIKEYLEDQCNKSTLKVYSESILH
jgi:hypothetical protein